MHNVNEWQELKLLGCQLNDRNVGDSGRVFRSSLRAAATTSVHPEGRRRLAADIGRSASYLYA